MFCRPASLLFAVPLLQVLNDTLRESTRAYDGTANLFNDSETNLTWPDWQIQWLEAGVNPEYADMPYEEEMAE